MPSSWGLTLGLSALIVFVLYRRGRRLLVRQRFNVPRLCFRVALIAVITTGLAVVLSMARGPFPLAGLAAGAAIGIVGIGLTRFDSDCGELHFTPNRYLGLAVLSLFVGRMLYRFGKLLTMDQTTAGSPDPASLSTFETLRSSPTLGAVLLLLLGYYLTYSAAVLIRGLRLREQPARP